MQRSVALTCLLAASPAGIVVPRSVAADQASSIAGVWTLNKSLSEMPRELGFETPWPSSGNAPSGSAGSSGSGGRGRRGGSGGGGRGGGTFPVRESYDD